MSVASVIVGNRPKPFVPAPGVPEGGTSDTTWLSPLAESGIERAGAYS